METLGVIGSVAKKFLIGAEKKKKQRLNELNNA